MRRVHLEICSWTGLCAGAMHFYGDLVPRWDTGSKVRVQRDLSAADARQINRENEKSRYLEDYMRVSPGDPCDQFMSEEDVIEAAVTVFRKRFDEQTHVLLLGNRCVCDPQPVLWALGEHQKKLGDLARRWEEHGGWDGRGNEDNAQVLADEWDRLCEIFDDEEPLRRVNVKKTRRKSR